MRRFEQHTILFIFIYLFIFFSYSFDTYSSVRLEYCVCVQQCSTDEPEESNEQISKIYKIILKYL